MLGCKSTENLSYPPSILTGVVIGSRGMGVSLKKPT
jgi:hypothetical protein